MSQLNSVRTVVESSLLAAARYSSDQTLELEFRSGAVYRYFDVPQTVSDALIAADSKGAYFNGNVRRRFRYQRVA